MLYCTLQHVGYTAGTLPRVTTSATTQELHSLGTTGCYILLVSRRTVMGAFTASRSLITLGWIATAVMGAAAVRMFLPD